MGIVAYIRVTDSYKEGVVIAAFEKLISWAKQQGLFKQAQFFGMSLDDPMVTPQEKYRYEACMTIPDDIQIEVHQEISTMRLPACQYTTTQVSGDISRVATATSYLFNDWLINHYFEPEHQYALEVFLDKENICNWNHFDLELCIPIKHISHH